MKSGLFADPKTAGWKDDFIERYSALTDWDEFAKWSLTYLRKSIRINTLKTTVKEVTDRLKGKVQLEPIPWCKEGFWVKGERRDFGNMIEHMMGYFYIQESASMIPPVVLDPQPGDVVLDMCAAPGSKTTQLAQYMQNKGVLMANDIAVNRIRALGFNLQRMGVSNCIVSMMKGHTIKNFEFDRILVDAPCSGIGTIRKSFKTIQMWNPNSIKRLVKIQKELATNAYHNLKSGGTMVYSTCSTEPEENEGVVDYLLSTHEDLKCVDIKLNIKKGNPITEFEGETYSSEVKKTLRLWPQDNDTEGFFISKFVKE